MPDNFRYDVFLSHSAKDKDTVHGIAERLKQDGLQVWFDEWEIKVGDSIPSKIDQGLEASRVLVLCMSANAFTSDWAELESQTFRFRDPMNKERRFIPLRLDDAEIKVSLAHFAYVDWRPDARAQAYPKLLAACSHLPADTEFPEALKYRDMFVQFMEKDGSVFAVRWSPDGTQVLLTKSNENKFELWDPETKRSLCVLEGHTAPVRSVSWSPDGTQVLSGSEDTTVRMWDVFTSRCIRVFEGHTRAVNYVRWRRDGKQALSAASDNTVRVWEVFTGRCLCILEGHMAPVLNASWSPDGTQTLTGSEDTTVRVWDVATGRCIRVFKEHTGPVLCVSWSPDGTQAMSGSEDTTVRVWDVVTGRCIRVLEGHTAPVQSVVWSPDGTQAFSETAEFETRTWDFRGGQDKSSLLGVQEAGAAGTPEAQIQYTNAKVLLVGDTSAGKTGLSMRLAGKPWKASDSTVGAWATHWNLGSVSAEGLEREVWLWDFGGQADQRLIHQLFMEKTAVAVLVFDGQKDDVFESLGQWDRDLARASKKPFTKLLAAGRIDAGALRVSEKQLRAFAEQRGYGSFLKTSAKKDIGCAELKQAIIEGIHWENIPWRTSPVVFKRLKDEIVRLKDSGRVLMRFNELRDALLLALPGEEGRFTDAQLKAVVGLLAGPGVVWELGFGSWVLLQPERINAYAQAVIQTMREDELERGCIPEARVLAGDLTYHSSIERLDGEEERFVLLAMHQILVERGLCLREDTEHGPMLIFPSYYRRERPDIVGHPSVYVSYRFNGFLDDIYATLVVRLHHTAPFERDQLWRYAADFKAAKGQQLGVKLTRRAEGAGELDVYFDPAIADAEKIIFSRYVHEHLVQTAQDVVRLRHYVCPHCGTPVGNREVAMKRLNGWIQKEMPGDFLIPHSSKMEVPTIVCVECEKRVPLWDDIERQFASPETQQCVRQLEERAKIVLDTESKERVLVGNVISTVALAGQICREFNVSDHGIDAEIEFKDDNGEATGKKLYLQLKSGDSYLRERKQDDEEIFTIKKERHARYWMQQAFPVMLVIRNSEGEIRWMEIRECLKRESDNGKKTVKQIVFEGDRFDVMAVRCWRDWALAQRIAEE